MIHSKAKVCAFRGKQYITAHLICEKMFHFNVQQSKQCIHMYDFYIFRIFIAKVNGHLYIRQPQLWGFCSTNSATSQASITGQGE